MNAQATKNHRRRRRRLSVRAKIRHTTTLPRLSVHRTLKHIYAQVIDDASGKTLAACGTAGKAVAGDLAGKTKSERAAVIGAEIAKRAKEAGVERVVLDRGSSKYHGRLKALADAARKGGLEF